MDRRILLSALLGAPVFLYGFKLFDPEGRVVFDFSSLAFRHFEKARTWLHVAAFVNNDNRREPFTIIVVLARDLAKEMRQTRIVCFQMYRRDLSDQIGVSDGHPCSCSAVHDISRLGLCQFPFGRRETVSKLVSLHTYPRPTTLSGKSLPSTR